MSSTFTTSKNLQKPAAGDFVDTWATPVNANWDEIDNSLAGATTINVTGVAGGTHFLSITQYQPPNIIFNGTIGAALLYLLPTGVGWIGSVFNNTTGGFLTSFGVLGGTIINLPQGTRSMIVCDGVNVQLAQSAGVGANPTQQVTTSPINGSAVTYMRSDAAPAINQAMTPTWSGVHTFGNVVNLQNPVNVSNDINMIGGSSITATSATVTVQTQAITDNSTKAASTAFVQAFAAPLASPALTGTPTAPTAAGTSNTTQIATTAMVQAALAFVTAGSSTVGSAKFGKMIINWGTVTTPGSSPTGQTYTTAYTTQVFGVLIYNINGVVGLSMVGGYHTALTGFAFNFGGAGAIVGWLAIGY